MIQFDFYNYIEELHDIYDLYTVDKDELPAAPIPQSNGVQMDTMAKRVLKSYMDAKLG